jgi:hypothetical protein
MDFKYDHRVIASIAPVLVKGAPGVGRPQLVIEMTATLQPEAKSPPTTRIVAVGGEVALGKRTIVDAL